MADYDFKYEDLVLGVKVQIEAGKNRITVSKHAPRYVPLETPTWYEVTVLDDQGGVVQGLEMGLSSGASDTRGVTDTDGRIRWEGEFGVVGSLRFLDVQQVRNTLFPKWEMRTTRLEYSLPADAHEVIVRDPMPPVSVAQKSPCHIVLKPHILRVRLVGLFFEHGKSFLLPSAMKGISMLRDIYDSYPNARFLIVGHTNTVSKTGPEYNDKLSLERADAIHAFMRDDVDAWYAWYDQYVSWEKQWGKAEDRHMLGALPLDSESKYLTESTYWSFREFQEAKGLSPTGKGDEATRRVLISDYMAHDRTTLPDSAEVLTHGCGQHFIDVEPGEADENRRVEIFVFDCPITPSSVSDLSGAGATDYPAWRAQVLETFDFTLNEYLIPHRLRLLDYERKPVQRAQCEIRTADKCCTAKTDDNGMVRFFAPVETTLCNVTWMCSHPDIDNPIQVVRNDIRLQPIDSNAFGDRLTNLGYLDESEDDKLGAYRSDFLGGELGNLDDIINDIIVWHDGGIAPGEATASEETDPADPSTTVAPHRSPRIRLSLFDFSASFTKRATAAEFEMDDELLDMFRDARIDDYSLVCTVTFNGEDEAHNANPPKWHKHYRPRGQGEPHQTRYLQQLIEAMHARNAQVLVGYEMVERGFTPSDEGKLFRKWLLSANDAQITQHAKDIVDFFRNKQIDIDGIGYDFELNGLDVSYETNLRKLFAATATALSDFKNGAFLYYDNAPFQPKDGEGSTNNMKPLKYALANVADNVIARPMCYNGSVSSTSQIMRSIECALAPESAGGGGLTPAHLQMAIDVSRTSDFEVALMCAGLFSPNRVGMTIYTMPSGRGPQVHLLRRAKLWEAALNFYAAMPPPGTVNEPHQVPIPTSGYFNPRSLP